MLPGNAGNLPQDDQGLPGQVSWPRVLLLPFSCRAALFMHPQCPRPSHRAINAVITSSHFQSRFMGTGFVDVNSLNSLSGPAGSAGLAACHVTYPKRWQT